MATGRVDISSELYSSLEDIKSLMGETSIDMENHIDTNHDMVIGRLDSTDTTIKSSTTNINSHTDIVSNSNREFYISYLEKKFVYKRLISTQEMRYTGSRLENGGSLPPISTLYGNIGSYKDDLYYISAPNYYIKKKDATTWDGPFKIDILSDNTYYYKPILCVVDDVLHVLYELSTVHLTFDGTTWTKEANTPDKVRWATSVNNVIHCISDNESSTGSNHYSFINGNWVYRSSLDYVIDEENLIGYNGMLHCIGGCLPSRSGTSAYFFKHVTFNNKEWYYNAKSIDDGVNTYFMKPITYNNKLNVFYLDYGKNDEEPEYYSHKILNETTGEWIHVHSNILSRPKYGARYPLMCEHNGSLHIIDSDVYKVYSDIYACDLYLPKDAKIYGGELIINDKSIGNTYTTPKEGIYKILTNSSIMVEYK